MNEPKGLYRNQHDEVIGGVCSGIAQALNVDPVLIRIAFILLAIFGGGGVLLYIILWIVLPPYPDYYHNVYQQKSSDMETENPNDSPNMKEPGKAPQPPKSKNDGNLIAGLILITLGAIFLLERWVYWLDFADLWPLLLVVGGIVLIRRSFMKP
jgi:phage shock protein PspC (stress-responsive transcriptional regulator)